MSNTPTWLQVAIPVFTLVGGFFAGRLSKVLDRKQEVKEAKANERPSFEVTYRSGAGFRLQNNGDAAATNVRIDSGAYPRGRLMHLPDEPFDLGIGQPVDFIMSTGLNMPKPAAFVVRCDELPEGTHVPVP